MSVCACVCIWAYMHIYRAASMKQRVNAYRMCYLLVRALSMSMYSMSISIRLEFSLPTLQAMYICMYTNANNKSD